MKASTEPLSAFLDLDRKVGAKCPHCGAHEPLDIANLIERYGADASFAVIAAMLQCWFCKAYGLEVFELVGSRSGDALPISHRLA